MTTYETVFALPAVLMTEELEQSIKDVENCITGQGGSVISSESMGEQKMAYMVQKCDRARYHLITFECPPSSVKEIKRHYRIHDKYIRDIVVIKEGK